MFQMEVKQRVSLTIVLLSLMKVGLSNTNCKALQKQVKLSIGRNSTISMCNTHIAVVTNQSYHLVADGYDIQPSCSMFFTGIAKHNKRFTRKRISFQIAEIELPCGVNNTIYIKEWQLGVFINRTTSNKYLQLNDAHQPRAATYYCDSVLQDKSINLGYGSILQISMNIRMLNYTIIPSVTVNVNITDYSDSNGSWSFRPQSEKLSTYSGVLCDCHGEDPQCQRCKMLAMLLNTIPDDEEQESLDINTIITVAGGVVSSLFIPIILLLVRNYMQKRRSADLEADDL